MTKKLMKRILVGTKVMHNAWGKEKKRKRP
jgi:hypothetical protein